LSWLTHQPFVALISGLGQGLKKNKFSSVLFCTFITKLENWFSDKKKNSSHPSINDARLDNIPVK